MSVENKYKDNNIKDIRNFEKLLKLALIVQNVCVYFFVL